MCYDYEKGRERIENILSNNAEIKECDAIPKDDSNFTYENGVKTWVGSIFVDIVGSTQLINENNKLIVAKILRAFSSEIIAIMNSSNNVREIGLRGDCVYGIYSVSTKDKVYELADIAIWINTLIKMLNKLLESKSYKKINVGIGVAIGNDLVIKAGQKGTGINDKIWIGDAVVEACNLGNVAGRNGKSVIAFSRCAYDNFIEKLVNSNLDKKEEEIKNWFTYDYSNNCYFANIIKTDFNNYVEKI